MQPHQYPVSGYPPDASWPDEYPPAPAPGGPAPAVPVAIGATAAGVGALALLILAVVTLVVFRAGPEPRDDGDVIVTVLIVWASLVVALLVAYSIGLIVAGRDAGRSGIVWIGVAALPWTILIPAGIVDIADRWDEYLSEGFVAVTSVVSYACGGLAAAGLLTAMIALGIPPGRRWLAARVLARTGALWPPAPLVAAKKRFTFSALLGMGGCAAQLILTLLVTEDGDGRSTFLAVFAVVLVLLVAVPQLLGVWGGRLAFGGRRGGAHLARVAGVFLIYGVQSFVLIGVLNGLAGVFDTDAILPDAAGGPLAAVVTAAIMLGIVQYVAGLAALADPRSELYLRSGGRRPG